MTQTVNDLLERHFETAFAAPDGITKLRELILKLAMQGKLVPQDPNGPPASELLKSIEAEKQRLIEENKIKKPKPLPPIKPEEVPYQLPQGWKWVRLGDLGITQTGTTPPSKDRESFGNYIPFVGPGDIKNGRIDYSGEGLSEEGLSKGRLIDSNSVLMVCIGGSIGKHAINDRKITCNQQINTLTPYDPVPVKYIYDAMAAAYFQNALLSQAGGSATPIINKQKWSGIPVPVPPLREQHRIVARIDQLMARCDELEKLRKDREEKRLQVHAAAIKQLLDEPDNAGWPFVQQHFGELYSVKENVSELRKAILQLAVMGKLVQQIANDSPASQLIEEVKAEKQKLVKAGKAKNSKPLPGIAGSEIPFALPVGWTWVRLGEIGYTNIGLTYVPSNVSDTGIPVLRSSNIQNGKLDLSDLKRVDAQVKDSVLVKQGDLLICARNGSKALVGKTALISDLPEPMAFGAFMAIFRSRFNQYLLHFINSPLFRKMIDEVNTMTINQITQDNLRSTLCPLPPLAEQMLIVAKIDELMILCDSLEEQIDAADNMQTELLSAVMERV